MNDEEIGYCDEESGPHRKPTLLERLTAKRDLLAARLDNVNRAIDVVQSDPVAAETYALLRGADRY